MLLNRAPAQGWASALLGQGFYLSQGPIMEDPSYGVNYITVDT